MSTQKTVFEHQQVTARGTHIRKITVHTEERITERFYQLVLQHWVPYKRVVVKQGN